MRRDAALMETTTDPRPLYDRSLTWVRGLIAAVRPEQLGDATPCPEFDVRALLSHLVGTVERIRGLGEGLSPADVPAVVSGVADDGWVAALDSAATRMRTVWTDDALLDRGLTVPWGTVAGRDALWGYVGEALVHGWDLAVATGQNPEAYVDVAEAALVSATAKIPAGMRGGPVPFGPVVEPAPGAGPTERLANWAGHRRP